MATTRLTLFFTLAFAILVSSCDDAVIDPFSNDGKYFTVYGYLDYDKNFQFGASHTFRISAITRRPVTITRPEDPNADLDARVFLVNVTRESTLELTGSLYEIEKDNWGHIFSARTPLQPFDKYRLEIVRSDGKMTYAEVQIPGIQSVVAETDDFVENQAGKITQKQTLLNIKSLWQPEILYHVGTGICFQPTTYSFPYEGELTDDGWQFDFNLTDDLEQIRQQTNGENTPLLCGMGVRAKLLNDEWVVPKGDVNLETIALPSELTNVVNGYGFVGAMGLYQNDWTVSDELRNALLNQ